MAITQWAWVLTLKPYDDTDTITLTLSDAAFEVSTTEQAEPGVTGWTNMVTGRAHAHRPGWFNATTSARILSRSYADQDPDDTLVTLFQTRSFLEAEGTLELIKLADEASPRVMVFQGVIDRIQTVDRYTVTMRLRGQAATAHRPALYITRARFPQSRQVDQNTRAPVLIGEVGWTAPSVLREMINEDPDAPGQPGLETNKEWAYLLPTRGHSPARVVHAGTNATDYQVRPASQSNVAAEIPNAFTSPPVAFLWPDDPRSPLWALEAVMSGDNISIPKTTAADYPLSSSPLQPVGGTQDGQILVRRFHCPNEVDDESIFVAAPFNAGWVNPQNALDRTNIASYAHTNGDVDSNEAWFRCSHRFMRYPSRPYLTVRQGDGAAARLFALVWAKQSNAGITNAVWELEMKVFGQTIVQVTRDLTGLPAGWALIWWDVITPWDDFPGVDDFIAFNGTLAANRKWYGENGVDPGDNFLEGIAIRCVDGERHFEPPRLAMFGLTFDHLVDPGALTGLTKGSYLRGLEMRGDQARPASVMVGFEAQGAAKTPGAAVSAWLVDATVEAKDPIPAGDIDQSGGFGSYNGLDTQLNADISTATGGVVTSWILSAVEEADIKVEDILGKLAVSVFAHFWYSTRAGLHRVEAFKADVAANVTDPLLAQDISEDEIVLFDLSLANVFTAINAQCWNRSRTLTIDNSTVYQSRDWKGDRDTTREAEADAVQALYGHRPLDVNLEYVRDPAAAWEVVVRMWDYFRMPRPTVRFGVDPVWGLDREPMEVFTADATLDGIMPVPVFGLTTWDGSRWRINSIDIDPRGRCFVTATWNDAF